MALPARDKHDDLTPEEIAAPVALEQRVRDAALDTAGFLRLILADNGYICIGIKLDKGYHHKFFQDFDEAAAYALTEDAREQAVYHACATFISPANRKQVNVAYLKALWTDVDVGDDKPYKTRAAAGKALVAFLEATKLPDPTIVYSGERGFHLYWVLDASVTKEVWKPYAVALRELMKAHGFAIDTSRSADSSSVLRPPGTHNRKRGLAEPVTIAHLAPPVRLADLGLQPQAQARPAPRSAQPQPQGAPDAAAFGDAMPPPTEHEVARVVTALSHTDSSDRNEVWFPFGGAIHDLPGWPEELRRAVWDYWSIQMDPTGKFDKADQDKTWESLGRGYEGKRATLGSIFHHAQQKGWDGSTVKTLPDEIKALVPPPVEVKTSDAGNMLMNVVRRLARLPYVDYMLERKSIASEHGVTLRDLDTLVKHIRNVESEPAARAAADAVAAAEEAADLEQQRQDLGLVEPKAWEEPVDGHALILELGQALKRYIVMPDTDVLVTVLWILHTYVYDRFKCTPRLGITAPEPECGKTTLLDLVEQLVNRPYRNDLPTGPGLFRTIELGRPTTLVDEVELLFRSHGDAAERSNDLLSVLNLGHRRGGRIGRLMPWKKTYRMQHFHVFAPVAYAVRGDWLPPTLWSRSIHVRLERKLADELVDDYDESRDEVLLPLQRLASMCRRWCDNNVELIAAHRPERFKGIGNRFLNNWKPLLAVAHVAGWGNDADDVMKLRARDREITRGDTGILVLADCRRVRDRLPDKKQVRSAELTLEFNKMDDREWGEYRAGVGVTARWIAAILHNYKIYAEERALRFADGTEARGYLWKSFELAWKRYLPPPQMGDVS